MKRIILGLTVFLFAAAALGQVGIPPGVVNVVTAPSGSCSQGTPGQKDNTGNITTCQGPFVAGFGTWTGAAVSTYPGVTTDGANGLTATGAVASGTVLSEGQDPTTPLQVPTLRSANQRSDFMADISLSIPMGVAGEIPSIGQPITISSTLPSTVAGYIKANAGCSGGTIAVASGCTFRYPLWNMGLAGAGFPKNAFYNTGSATSGGPLTCWTINVSNNCGIPYYIDFIYNNQYFYISTYDTGAQLTMQVDGKWTTQYLNYSVGTASGAIELIPVTFSSARPRHIRILVSSGFLFGGIVTEAGSADITAPTSSNFPSNPVIIVASDSTGQGAVEQGKMPWPLRLGQATNSPVYDSSVGGTGFVVAGTSPNVNFPTRYSHDICSFITSIGQTSGVILHGNGLNDSASSAATVTANANTVFAGIAACAPNWIQDYIGIWSPATPVLSGLATTQAAVQAAFAGNGVYQTSDMIGEKWFSGTEPMSSACPAVPVPASDTTHGNACTFISTNGPHPTQAGADYAAWRILGDLTSTNQWFPNTLTVPDSFAVPLSPALTNYLAQTYVDPACDAKNGGTIQISGGTTLTGTGTTFTKCLAVGSVIAYDSSSDTIASITNDTTATLQTSSGNFGPGQYFLATPQPACTFYANGLFSCASTAFLTSTAAAATYATIASPTISGTLTNGSCASSANCITLTNGAITHDFNITDQRFRLSSNGNTDFGLQSGGTNLSGGAIQLGASTTHVYVSGGGGILVGNMYGFDAGSTTVPAWQSVQSKPFQTVRGLSTGGGTQAVSGCSLSANVGGLTGGQFASGTTGTCTVTITIGSSAANNGWSCWANDITTPADVLHQTASGVNSATISGTTVSGDVINYGCLAY